MIKLSKIFLFMFIFVNLIGCEGGFLGEKETGARIQGKRISVNLLQRKIIPDDTLNKLPVTLPAPFLNYEWLQPNGNASHVMQHLAFADVPNRVWQVSIGAGSSGDTILLASPVVNNDRLFSLDSEANLKAFNSYDGSLIWEKNLNPAEKDAVYSGAITVDFDSIFVALGSGELICVEIKSGNEKWRVANKSPLRSAPTISDGRLFVVTIDNKTLSFSASTGELLWSHSGVTETAALLGGASPAVKDNVVIVTYSSGEIFALKAQTGRVFWGDYLGSNKHLTGVANITDIRGSPVINKSLAFIITHSGRLIAIDFKSGKRVWEKSIAGANTPWIAGDYMFVVSNDGEVICISHTDGRIKWLSQMPEFESPNDQEGIIKYGGPILAGDRLLVVSSLGEIYSISPYTGAVLGKVNVGGSIFIPPIIANKTMFVLNDKGLLTAFR